MAELPLTPETPAHDAQVQRWRPPQAGVPQAEAPQPAVVREIGGRKDGTDPTRYGDWEKHGRCIDF